MVSLRVRRVLTRQPRWWSNSSFLLTIIIMIVAFNFAVIIFYSAVSPFLQSRHIQADHRSGGESLWDTNQDPEADCGEGKGKILNTDWILKLIQTASKMLRNYRRKNLERMERGMSGTVLAEDDVFTLMQPLLTFISDPKNKSPDFMKMVPQLMTLWFKIQRSGMFSSTEDVAAGGPAAGQAQQAGAPVVDMEMLNQLLALLPKT